MVSLTNEKVDLVTQVDALSPKSPKGNDVATSPAATTVPSISNKEHEQLKEQHQLVLGTLRKAQMQMQED